MDLLMFLVPTLSILKTDLILLQKTHKSQILSWTFQDGMFHYDISTKNNKN